MWGKKKFWNVTKVTLIILACVIFVVGGTIALSTDGPWSELKTIEKDNVYLTISFGNIAEITGPETARMVKSAKYDWTSSTDSAKVVDFRMDEKFNEYKDKVWFWFNDREIKVDGTGKVRVDSKKLSEFKDFSVSEEYLIAQARNYFDKCMNF